MTTLTTLLFGSAARGRRYFDTVLGPAGFDVHQVTVAGLAVEPPQVSGALLDVLDQPLSTVCATAWNSMREVRRARRHTLEEPGSREVVALGAHTVTSTQEPSVEASVGGATVTVLHVLLEVEVKVSGLRLVVEVGQVTRTLAGDARARARVSVEGAVLVERDFQPVDLGEPPEPSALPTSA